MESPYSENFKLSKKPSYLKLTEKVARTFIEKRQEMEVDEALGVITSLELTAFIAGFTGASCFIRPDHNYEIETNQEKFALECALLTQRLKEEYELD